MTQERRDHIRHTLIDTLSAEDGAGSDLETFEHDFDEWWTIYGALDMEHLVSEVEALVEAAKQHGKELGWNAGYDVGWCDRGMASNPPEPEEYRGNTHANPYRAEAVAES